MMIFALIFIWGSFYGFSCLVRDIVRAVRRKRAIGGPLMLWPHYVEATQLPAPPSDRRW